MVKEQMEIYMYISFKESVIRASKWKITDDGMPNFYFYLAWCMPMI
jgi:hypothetical protein